MYDSETTVHILSCVEKKDYEHVKYAFNLSKSHRKKGEVRELELVFSTRLPRGV